MRLFLGFSNTVLLYYTYPLYSYQTSYFTVYHLVEMTADDVLQTTQTLNTS